MKKIVLDVTEKDIQEGLAGDYTTCPIARAYNRILNPQYIAKVYINQIQIAKAKDQYDVIAILPISKTIHDFIWELDIAKRRPKTFQENIDVGVHFNYLFK